MLHYLEFDAFDNPMQLSKVGNWVITFLDQNSNPEQVQLAITHVLPRQISDHLQPRRVIIHSCEQENLWEIETIECFDSKLNQELPFEPEAEIAQQVIADILKEFDRYDVCIQHRKFS